MPHYLARGIEDHRNIYEKLRRQELYAIMEAENMTYPQGIPADSAREIIKSAGVSLQKYLDEMGQFNWPETKKKTEENTQKNYEKMKMHEIRKLCTQLGVEYTFKHKKAELIEKLKDK